MVLLHEWSGAVVARQGEREKRENRGSYPGTCLLYKLEFSCHLFHACTASHFEPFRKWVRVGRNTHEHKSQGRKGNWLRTPLPHICGTLSSNHNFPITTVRMFETKHSHTCPPQLDFQLLLKALKFLLWWEMNPKYHLIFYFKKHWHWYQRVREEFWEYIRYLFTVEEDINEKQNCWDYWHFTT